MGNQIFKKGLVWLLTLAMIITSLSLSNGTIVANAAPDDRESTYGDANPNVLTDSEVKSASGIGLVYSYDISYDLSYTPNETFTVDSTTYTKNEKVVMGTNLEDSDLSAKIKNAGVYDISATVTYKNTIFSSSKTKKFEYTLTVKQKEITVVNPVDYVKTVTPLATHFTRINLLGVNEETIIGEYFYPDSTATADIDTPDVKNLSWKFSFPEKITANNYKAVPAEGTNGRVIFRSDEWTTDITGSVTAGEYGGATTASLTVSDNAFGTPNVDETWTYTVYEGETDTVVQGPVTVTEEELAKSVTDIKRDGAVNFDIEGLLPGDYTVKVNYSDGFTTTDGEGITLTGEYTSTFTVAKRKVNLLAQTDINKVYDETTLAYTVDAEGNINDWTFDGSATTLDRYVDGDALTITATGAYASADAAENVTVNWSNIVLSGDDVDKYELENATGISTGNITKGELTVECNSAYFTLKKDYTTPDMSTEFNFSAQASYLGKIDEAKDFTVDNVEFSTHDVTSEINRKFTLVDSELVPAGLEINEDGTIKTASTETTNDNTGSTNIWPVVKAELTNANYDFTNTYEIPYRVVGVDIYNITLTNMDNAAINDEDWTATYIAGEGKTLPTDVTKEHYTFDGWVDLEGNTVTEISDKEEGARTFEATWTPVVYAITYDKLGVAPDVEGTTTNPTTYTVEDSEITLSNPTRAGYDFLGWTDEENKEITTIDPSEGKERTITAHWELITYDITYTYPEGVEVEVTANKNPETYNVENGTFSFVDPIRKGYTFNGWTLTKVDDTDKNEPISAIIKGTLTGDLTLNGTFTATAYDINYDLDGGVNAEVNPATYTIEDNAITLANPTKKGYNFSKWVDDKDDEVTEIPAGSTGEVSVKAVWTRDTYTISYDLAGGTTAEANPESYNVDTETITLVDATKKGYTFDGWYNGDEKVTKIETGSVGNLTLVAKFTLDIYNVTYDLAGGTNAEANPATYNVNSDTITLADPTKENYTFAGWVDNENKEVTEIPAGSTGNVELTATWTAIDYDITYTGVEGATNTNPTTYNVETKTITLAKAAKKGYTFKGWYNGETKVTEIPTGSAGAIALEAKFTLDTYKVTYDLAGGTNAKANPTTYNVNSTKITLAKATRGGYDFAGWVDKAGKTVTEIKAGSTGNVELTAKWTKKNVLVTKVALDKTSKTMYVGATTTLKATVSPTNATNKAVTWKSSDTAVATVSSKGVVTTKKAGTATITVTTKDGNKKATCKVTVKKRTLIATGTKASATSVKLTWLKVSEADGYEIYGDICGATSGYITKVTGASTLTKTISKIDKKALKSTYYKFSVKAYKMIDGKKVYLTTSNTSHVMLQNSKTYANATGVKVSTTSVSLKKGKTQTITASAITPSGTKQKSGHGAYISYYTSNASVATVSTSGKITAQAAGTCTIYVVATDGKYKKVSVTVK